MMDFKPDIAIKIYGERNSGTNFLESLVAINLQAQILKVQVKPWEVFILKRFGHELVQDLLHLKQRNTLLGWKHGCPTPEQINRFHVRKLLVLTLSKNPYTFARSLHRRPYHLRGANEVSFGEFLQQKWPVTHRDRCSPHKRLTPIELWNHKNQSYLALREKTQKTVVNIRYEDLLANPEKAIALIASAGPIQWRHGNDFHAVTESTKDSPLTFIDYKAYYLGGQWLQDIQAEHLDIINTQLDHTVRERLGYDRLAPEDLLLNMD